ncbi:hypothetical protein MASSI9I_90400 [Massilia sp. 9I]|nr:hypothetical protein MASSI9I_90400 [Massilia sp. 9I]
MGGLLEKLGSGLRRNDVLRGVATTKFR